MTGAGTGADPFLADGLSDRRQPAAPQAGDRFQIQPTSQAVSGMSACWSRDPEKIAAAAPLLTCAAPPTNSGTRRSSTPATVTSTAAWVRGDYTLAFTATGGWQVTDAGNTTVATGGSYTAGSADHLQWHAVAVSGTPAAGDSFTINDNGNGTGDNRNALRLAGAARPAGTRRRHALASVAPWAA